MAEHHIVIDDELSADLTRWRRATHAFPELGWTEVWTSAYIADALRRMNVDFTIGKSLFDADLRLGLPSDSELETAFDAAMKHGADESLAASAKGGFTGVVATIGSGKPSIGLRFDIDALPIHESSNNDHLPAALGFRSSRAHVMHACGHDFHIAVGLGVASMLTRHRDALHGTVHLIFQPAEEGVRGARAMVGAGLADDLDYVIAHHNRTAWREGVVRCGILGYQATTKTDVVMCGTAAHAGGSPHEGHNAIQAAAAAVQGLYAIPRHSGGTTRINVGTLNAGSGRNVIADRAEMTIETRGETAKVERYMHEAAQRILKTSAEMFGCTVKTRCVGSAPSAESSPELSKLAEHVAEETFGWEIREPTKQMGSEDFTYFMQHVQRIGGKATHISMGARIPGRDLRAHTDTFDADEGYMPGAVEYLTALTTEIDGLESHT